MINLIKSGCFDNLEKKGFYLLDESFNNSYECSSYYDTHLRGLEDSSEFDDISEAKDWVWNKVSQGHCVSVLNKSSGRRFDIIDPDFEEIDDPSEWLNEYFRTIDTFLNEDVNNKENLREEIYDFLDYLIDCDWYKINPDEWLGCESWQEVKESIQLGAIDLYESAQGLLELIDKELSYYDNSKVSKELKTEDPEYDTLKTFKNSLLREMKNYIKYHYDSNLNENAKSINKASEELRNYLQDWYNKNISNELVSEVDKSVKPYFTEFEIKSNHLAELKDPPVAKQNQLSPKDDFLLEAPKNFLKITFSVDTNPKNRKFYKSLTLTKYVNEF